MLKRAFLLAQCLILLLAAAAPAQPAVPPSFSPLAGVYPYAAPVELSSATRGAQIYYTSDGTTPTTGSSLYTGPLVLTRHASLNHDPDPLDANLPRSLVSYSLKAIATKNGLADSPVSSADFVIDRVEHAFNLAYDSPPPGNCSNKHLLDIYSPRGQAHTPVVFFVHGGAWREGDKNIYLELGNTLAGDYQLTTVIINYRLTNDACKATHPDHIQDVAKAFAWTAANIASYGGDPANIHLFGQSAGAHLAALLAADGQYLDALGLSTSQIQSVTAMSGAYNLGLFVQSPDNPLGLSDAQVLAYRNLFILVFGNLQAQTLQEASPGYQVSASLPPMHIIGLQESANFSDMPGFAVEAANFYDQVAGLNGPPVTLNRLSEADIPPEILALDFPDFTGDVDGHYEEIYAINTVNWQSASTTLLASYIKSRLPLRLTWPNGGETLAPRADQVITWSSQPGITQVNLELSTDDGASWSDIASGLPNSGSYTWQVPLTSTWLARVRISGAAAGQPADISTQVFRIGPAEQVFLPLAVK